MQKRVSSRAISNAESEVLQEVLAERAEAKNHMASVVNVLCTCPQDANVSAEPGLRDAQAQARHQHCEGAGFNSKIAGHQRRGEVICSNPCLQGVVQTEILQSGRSLQSVDPPWCEPCLRYLLGPVDGQKSKTMILLR